MLTREQQTTLLRIARDSVERELQGQRLHVNPSDYDDELRRPGGAFVTLHVRGDELRGCIGSVMAVDPVCVTVARNAANAAFRDPRFNPVTAEEMAGVSFEISVLSEIVPIASIDEIVPGRDGLIVRRGHAAGLLLPQVATEYGWDRETFLAQTCRKAGLAMDAWRSPQVRIERFSAEVFGE